VHNHTPYFPEAGEWLLEDLLLYHPLFPSVLQGAHRTLFQARGSYQSHHYLFPTRLETPHKLSGRFPGNQRFHLLLVRASVLVPELALAQDLVPELAQELVPARVLVLAVVVAELLLYYRLLSVLWHLMRGNAVRTIERSHR